MAKSQTTSAQRTQGPQAVEHHRAAERRPRRWTLEQTDGVARVRHEVVEIDELLAGALGDARAHLDLERVARYAQLATSAPPVIVFDTPGGRLLVDGYHRIAAARRRGDTTVDAEIHEGSRRDALAYAAANASAQRAIRPDEALEQIRRHSGTRWGS
jgi:hypothetical protein